MPVRKCATCGTRIPKLTRQPNAYNAFVKEKMALPEIAQLKPTEKMSKIAELWKKSRPASPPTTPPATKPVKRQRTPPKKQS